MNKQLVKKVVAMALSISMVSGMLLGCGAKKEEENVAMDFVSQMRVGWNVGNSLDATNAAASIFDFPSKCEMAWGNPKITEELIDTVIASGFNVIRIPVSWQNHTAPAPSYKITETWMKRVKEVVDYAYNKDVFVILNLHHEEWNYPYYDNQDAACERMRAVWTQIAEQFADYDERLIFEAQNEPRKVGTDLEWNGGDQEGWDVVNATNKAFIETIRNSTGNNPNRFLMIPGYGANSTVGIQHIDVPEDDHRIIISVHAYVPYDFALNISGRSDWQHDTYDIDKLMADLKELYIDKGIPVIIGEFGALNKDNEAERVEWVTYYLNAAKEIGVPCIWWDNGSFNGSGENLGLFNRRTYEVAYPDILDAIMKATEEPTKEN